MAINLQSNNSRNITSQTRKRLLPKSIRFSHNELEILYQIKDRIEKTPIIMHPEVPFVVKSDYKCFVKEIIS